MSRASSSVSKRYEVDKKGEANCGPSQRCVKDVGLGMNVRIHLKKSAQSGIYLCLPLDMAAGFIVVLILIGTHINPSF